MADEELPVKAALQNYKTPYGTLYNDYHGKHIKNGSQSVFTFLEEKAIVKSAL